MSEAYIVLPTNVIGGLEKRLAGLFGHMASAGDSVRLVASEELVTELSQTPDCASITSHAASTISFRGGPNPFASLRSTMKRVLSNAPQGVFHYGLGSPLRLHASRSKRTLYTIPNASLSQYNARGMVEVYGGILRASRVDVLDPQVFAQLTSRFPWRRGSFSLTPGSFVDLDLFQPAAPEDKLDRIVFCGLFSEEKQAPRLVAALPELFALLARENLGHVEVWMLGRDAAGCEVTAAANRFERARAYFEHNPMSVLSRSKIFLSLQRSTNHPSKALLEAMACGCVPVVTDTRDSRRSAPDDLARYVPKDFTAPDLAEAIIPILRSSNAALSSHSVRARAFLDERFSIKTMATYYRLLYDQLRALPD